MTSFIHSVIAMAPPSGGQGGNGAGSFIPTILMFGGLIVIMYFLMIRPQQKRQKEHKQMLESVKKGDRVVTSSGIHGTVTDSDEKTLTIQIADNVKVKFEKNSVSSKL